MKLKVLKNWFWLVAGFLWGAVNGLFTLAYREPLTGWSPQAHILFAFVQGVAFGLATYCFLNLKWRVVASIVTVVAFFFSVLLPSMAGLKLRLENHYSNEILVSVARSDYPDRRIDLRLSPNASLIYTTAPGDWPGGAGLVISCKSNQVSATIRELRGKKVTFTNNEIALVDIAPSASVLSFTNTAIP